MKATSAILDLSPADHVPIVIVDVDDDDEKVRSLSLIPIVY
jgi:hypothetical protein